MNRIYFGILGGLFLLSCQGNSSEKSATNNDTKTLAQATESPSPKINTPLDSTWDAFSQLIAGSTSGVNTFYGNDSMWLHYSQQQSNKFGVLQKRIGTPISQWTKSMGYNEKTPVRTLLYPFAGGDYYYAHLFYPNVDTIIMVGLEPAGFLFDPRKQNREDLQMYLDNLEKSLFFPHKLGFFRTLSMETDFQKGLLNGTIHTCLYYLAKFGNRIHYIQAFDIDNNGNESNVVDMGTTAHKRRGIKIGYSHPQSKQVKELIYFTANLANSGMPTAEGEKHNGIGKYLYKRKNCGSFFKAATYLMHNSYFSVIRDICLDNSRIILQDDSGIPLKNLQKAGFEVTLLGKYTRTIGLFKNRFQPDLRAAYDSLQPQKLPFTIGYNAEFGECNMQLAVRRR